MPKLSIVVPCFNEEETVDIFYNAVSSVLDTMNITYEILFVNDGSKDNTEERLIELYHLNPNIVKVIEFSRNFGKEGALLAGLQHAKGEYVTVMDADLQDPPEYLPKMFERMEQNDDDVVGTRRVTRKGEPVIRSFFARSFYRIINRFVEVKIVDGARDFRLMKREVVDSILSLPEYGRFSKGLFAWVGYKTEYLEYENVERVAGETSWSFWKLFRYAIDGIVEYTNVPLAIATILGAPLTIVMLIELTVLLVISLIGIEVSTSTLLISLILFFGGAILLSVGILGEYMAKTYNEVKRRPGYIVKKFYE